jgi:hypothetical protein
MQPFFLLAMYRQKIIIIEIARINFFSSFSITIIRTFWRKITRFLKMVEVGSKNIDKDIFKTFFHF